MKNLLSIKNLSVKIQDKAIIENLNLDFHLGEIVALMGPNGSGKSTLGKVIAGHPAYEITNGEILYRGENILSLTPDVRANMGIYLGFQNPIEVSGVKNLYFLKNALNLKMKFLNQPELDTAGFIKLTKQIYNELEYSKELADKELNKGSGGENKRNEIFHMYTLRPTFALLDEIDSGLDIDALRIVGSNIRKFKNDQNTVVLITHYKRLLEYVIPDRVVVFNKGRVIKEGGPELAHQLENTGYGK